MAGPRRQDEAHLKEGGRYCKGCLYDLSGVIWAVASMPGDDAAPGGLRLRCPECGRLFDPFDADGTLASSARRGGGRLVRFSLVTVVVAGLVILGGAMGWIPRPGPDGLSSWRWLGRVYGTEQGYASMGAQYGYIRVTRWADDVRSVTLRDQPGSPTQLRVERLGGGEWRVSVDDPAVGWRETMWLLNAVGGAEDFGVRFGSPDKPGVAIDRSVVFEGRPESIARAMFETYELDPAFVMRRARAGGWTLVVTRPPASFDQILASFNGMREHRFGVRLAAGSPGTPEKPFAAAGTEADVFWALYRNYGFTAIPLSEAPPASDGWHPMGRSLLSVDRTPTRL